MELASPSKQEERRFTGYLSLSLLWSCDAAPAAPCHQRRGERIVAGYEAEEEARRKPMKLSAPDEGRSKERKVYNPSFSPFLQVRKDDRAEKQTRLRARQQKCVSRDSAVRIILMKR